MTTQFPDRYTNNHVNVTPTASRVTPEPARPFASVLRAGAGAVISGAEAAASRLPGGPLMSAAVRDPQGTGTRAEFPTGTTGISSGTPLAGLDASSNASGGDSSLQAAVQAQAENSLYYLQLQQQIQEETRAYTTLSNVLKARHETVKNAIGNIR